MALRRPIWAVAGVAWLFLCSAPAFAGPQLTELVQKFDQLFEQQFGKVTAECDSTLLLRRLSLDIRGRIPGLGEYSQFSTEASGFSKTVKEMLKSQSAREYSAHRLTERLLPKPPTPASRELFRRWLIKEFRQDSDWSRISKKLITQEGPVSGQNFGGLFLLQFRGDPAEAATMVSRQFLGRSLDCARCHDHPFADISQGQFHGFTANFAGLRVIRKSANQFELFESPVQRYNFKLKGSDKSTAFKPRTAAGLDLPESAKPRQTLVASWLQTVAKNESKQPAHSFCRAAVNREFTGLFGADLAGNIEDIGEAETDSALMTFLCEVFVGFEYKLDKLRELFFQSRAYRRVLGTEQLRLTESSGLTGIKGFRPISGYSLAHAFLYVAGRDRPNLGEPKFLYQRMRVNFVQRVQQLVNAGARGQVFGESLRQALFLQNDPMLQSLTQINANSRLKAILKSQSRDQDTDQGPDQGTDQDDVPLICNQLCLMTLGRRATKSELARWTPLIKAHGDEAYEDILWALTTSAEFALYR